MPTLTSGGTFENNWKNILDKLRSVLRTEYGNTLPVFIGDEDSASSSQYIRLDPQSSELTEYNVDSEIREFTINVFYVFSGVNVKKTALDHILRFVSRTEALIHDNTAMTLADSSNAFNCRFESTELGTDEEENVYIVSWVWSNYNWSITIFSYFSDLLFKPFIHFWIISPLMTVTMLSTNNYFLSCMCPWF